MAGIRATALLILLLSAQAALSQSTFQKFRNLKRPEKCWVLRHPFVAREAMRLAEQARDTALTMLDSDELDGDWDGGEVDAFRHAYWMALTTREIGKRRARSLGRAHEKANYIQFKRGELEDGGTADAKASEMDLHNNAVGISIGLLEEVENLKLKVVEEIRAGKMLVVWKNEAGEPLGADGEVIPESEWRGKWENGKVLVPSRKGLSD